MSELIPNDVESFTRGALLASDGETKRLLNAALAAARRYCGWRVTPNAVETVWVDGTGDLLLPLPTMCINVLTSAHEDNTALNLADLDWTKGDTASPPSRRMLSKTSGERWSSNRGAVKVVMDHGFSSAPDFQVAVLSMIERSSYTPGRYTAGPFSFDPDIPDEYMFTSIERAGLDPYRLTALV